MALALGAGALVAVAVLWPSARIEVDGQALAGLRLAPAGERLEAVSVSGPGGQRIAVSVRTGAVWPDGKLRPGERLEVKATIRRAGWIGWLVGNTTRVQAAIETPTARVASTILRPQPNGAVSIHFTGPAGVVVLERDGERAEQLMFRTPHSTVPTGEYATARSQAGSLLVAAAARSWETLSKPVRVSWFVAGAQARTLVRPAPGTSIEPTREIELTFSAPTEAILGATLPKVIPATPGRWSRPSANTLAFQPAGFGFGLGSKVSIVLPVAVTVSNFGRPRTAKELTFEVPQGRTLRLQQLLAGLGYLPLAWQPTTGLVPDNPAAQTEAALEPPAGTFSWRYASTPAQLKSLWNADSWTTMTQGAVMAFEHDQGLTVDGLAGPQVWRALLAASALGAASPHGSTYVLVHRRVPQTLELWHNGMVILHTLVNTGVPGAPTPYGTHAVFLHIASGTMSGTNPDGSRYHDPNIPWISYFNRGEAIHGFNRGSYGFPQSVGCVETAVKTAARIWPYTTIGTLVTIVP